jgi:hypothetical protein
MIGEASGHGDRELIEHKERVQVPQLRPAQTLNREAKDGKSTRNQELSCIIRGEIEIPETTCPCSCERWRPTSRATTRRGASR